MISEKNNSLKYPQRKQQKKSYLILHGSTVTSDGLVPDDQGP